MENRLLVIGDARMSEHRPGLGHPESPGRLDTVLAGLPQTPNIQVESAWDAPRDAIERVHEAAFVDMVEGCRGGQGMLDADTGYSPQSVQAAYLAAGAGIMAVDAAMGRDYETGFALTRPPGHHAEPDRAMGFCVFNNIAIAAEYARQTYGLQRILVVDWDVHHGNGTQRAFWLRRDVLFFSVHQWPFYPGTGEVHALGAGPGEGYTINCPLPPGMKDGVYGAIFEDILRPIAQRYRPQLVLVSAGFDAHRLDPLGGMALSTDGFARLCGQVKAIADEEAGGALALVLEGGYHLQALSQSVNGCLDVLGGAAEPQAHGPDTGHVSLVKNLGGYLLSRAVPGAAT